MKIRPEGAAANMLLATAREHLKKPLRSCPPGYNRTEGANEAVTDRDMVPKGVVEIVQWN